MRGIRRTATARPVMPSPILSATAEILALLMLVISVVILLRGHNAPGGGFIGGLVAAAAAVTIAYAFGARRARRLMRVHPITVAGVGLALALVSGLPAFLSATPFLTHLWGDVPTELGVLKLGTTYVFDLGVYLVVVGSVAAFFFMFEEG